MPLMEVKNLTKIFGSHPAGAMELFRQGQNRAQILKQTGHTLGVANVNFEVSRGEILVIMGLSGSGKSTLVRCLNRLIEPTQGSVRIDDQDIVPLGRRKLRSIRRHKIGMVFQKFALFPHRTVAENAAYGLEVTRVSAAKRRKAALDVLEMVGLEKWADRLPGDLSGGMQQRVGLARALALDPDIILMDEALSALDPLIRKDMQNQIVDLQRKLDKTIIFITHDLDEAINIGDRIVLMKDGFVVQQGTAEQILTNPATKYVERFVEDVDMSQVLTARSIMRPAHDVAHLADGPRTVLRKIRSAGTSSIFAVDNHGHLRGIVHAQTASDLVQRGGEDRPPESNKTNTSLVDENIKTATPDTTLQDLVPLMADNRQPIAIVDQNQKLLGVIVIGALLAGLAEGAPANNKATGL